MAVKRFVQFLAWNDNRPMRFKYVSNQKLFFLISILILFNLAFGAYLFNSARGQVTDSKDQKAIEVKLAEAKNAPIAYNVTGIDNSAKDFQIIQLTGRNVSSNPIRSSVMVLTMESGTVKVLTSYFSPPLAPNQFLSASVPVERVNIDPSGLVSIHLDYVLFTGGDYWGRNSAHQSERIQGYVFGYRQGLQEIELLLLDEQFDSIALLISKDLTEIMPNKEVKGKSFIWEQGYISGYRMAVYKIRKPFDFGGIDSLSSTLTELKNQEKDPR